MKYVVALVLLAVLGFFGGRYITHASDQKDQVATVENFYKAVIALNVRGLPSEDAMKQLTPHLSTKLREAIQHAQVAETQHTNDTYGSEAPFFQGPLFFGVWEGAQRLVEMQRDATAARVSYRVTLEMHNPNTEEPKDHWQDRVVLVLENGRWVVDDLIFMVSDDKSSEDTLSSKLREAASYESTYTQGDLKQFAHEAYQREDGGLNESYQQLISQLEVKGQQSLKTAQQAWLKFRDLQCEHEASAFEGGSIKPLIQNNCLIALTQQRNKEIKALLQEIH